MRSNDNLLVTNDKLGRQKSDCNTKCGVEVMKTKCGVEVVKTKSMKW